MTKEPMTRDELKEHQAFMAFHEKRPAIKTYFNEFAERAVRSLAGSVPAEMIMARAMWEMRVERAMRVDDVKLEFVAQYAERFMRMRPEFAGRISYPHPAKKHKKKEKKA